MNLGSISAVSDRSAHRAHRQLRRGVLRAVGEGRAARALGRGVPRRAGEMRRDVPRCARGMPGCAETRRKTREIRRAPRRRSAGGTRTSVVSSRYLRAAGSSEVARARANCATIRASRVVRSADWLATSEEGVACGARTMWRATSRETRSTRMCRHRRMAASHTCEVDQPKITRAIFKPCHVSTPPRVAGVAQPV